MDQVDTRSRPQVQVAHAPRAQNDRRRLHGSIAHDIGVDIAAGRYRPGDVLPSEDDFSIRLKVSRTAYREAIRILGAKGLVESRPKTGTRIRPRADWNFLDPDVLAWHLDAEPSDTLVASLFEVRDMVEPRAAELAAARRTEQDLAGMRAALDVMGREQLTSAAGVQADLDFHHALLIAARNEPLLALSPGIGATIRWSNLYKVARGRLDRDPLPEHVQVYEAIRDRDGVAARTLMTQLIASALASTLGR